MNVGRLRAVPHGVARLFARDRSLAGRLPTPVFIRLVYEIMLRRAPDGPGKDLYTAALRSGTLFRTAMLDHVRGSMEFRAHIGFTDLLVSLHHSRCDFIRSLPPARRILDLGGTDQGSRDGALVSMGYPYDFEELVIVDLPVELRHELYRSVSEADTVLTHRGPVRYRTGSMVDLSEFPDGSFDLVYSGQTIEHVTSDECDRTLAEIRRVLRPGGTFAVDTPNGPVCRVQTPEMINPDHKVEYSHAEFAAKLAAAGMTVVEAKGLNYCGPARALGVFDDRFAAEHHGIFAAIEDCYLVAYVAIPTVESGATCVGSAAASSDHPITAAEASRDGHRLTATGGGGVRLQRRLQGLRR